jgi:hypothetical protein
MAKTGWRIVASLAALPTLCAGAADDIGNATGWLELRPRYNRIEESDLPETTRGWTVRAIAGIRTAPWGGLRFTAEGIYADHVGEKRFNDDPGQIAGSPYPLLPDPRHAGVNRAFIEAVGIEDANLRVGRQKVEIDNRRWVSANDFRQVPQLFDGGTFTYSGHANVQLMGGYYGRLRSTSGETATIRLTVLHAAWNPAPEHSLAAFAYLHDQPRTSNFTGFADNSYRVYGLRAEGTAARFGAVDVPYEVELAEQRPYAGGDGRIDARYWRVGGGLSTARWTVRADYEVRGSNDGQYGLQIPLTDFYAFNGWTLHWFTVPRQGLKDGWVTGRWAIGRVTLYGEAHKFRSDFGALDFGREVDLGATLEILPNAILRLQHARYDPGSGRPADPEIRKTWLTLTYTYP